MNDTDPAVADRWFERVVPAPERRMSEAMLSRPAELAEAILRVSP